MAEVVMEEALHHAFGAYGILLIVVVVGTPCSIESIHLHAVRSVVVRLTRIPVCVAVGSH